MANFPLESLDYDMEDSIGRASALSTVYKASYTGPDNTKKFVALKEINLRRSHANLGEIEESADFLMKEHQRKKAESVLAQSNLLNVDATIFENRKLCVVMPLMSAGSILLVMSDAYEDGIPEEAIGFILGKVLNGVSYLHDQGKVHRDLKPGNILIHSEDGYYAVKIADYGVSSANFRRNMDSLPRLSVGNQSFPASYASNVFDKVYWLPPEVMEINSQNHDSAADIWLFGVTALELYHGLTAPITDSLSSLSLPLVFQISERLHFCVKEDESMQMKKPSAEFKNMVSCCLQSDPSSRWAAKKLLTHPFFVKNRDPAILKTLFDKSYPRTVEERYSKCVQPKALEYMSKMVASFVGLPPVIEGNPIIGWQFIEDSCKLEAVRSTESQICDAQAFMRLVNNDLKLCIKECKLEILKKLVAEHSPKKSELVVNNKKVTCYCKPGRPCCCNYRKGG